MARHISLRAAAIQTIGAALREGGQYAADHGVAIRDIPGIIRSLVKSGYDGWWNHEGQTEDNPEPRERQSLEFMRAQLKRNTT